MISAAGFLLFLGLIVFGPKKTIEMAQEAGRLVAKAKHAAGQLQQAASISVQVSAKERRVSIASSGPRQNAEDLREESQTAKEVAT